MRALVPALAPLLGLALAACGGTPERAAPAPTPSAQPTVAAPFRLPSADPVEPEQALSLVPASAEVVVLSDFDELRARFGFNDLTSDDLMTDRSAFWEQARRDAVLLGEGVLRHEGSRLWLDHGFSQDDVDWEARFSGPGGAGYVIAFRPDQDMTEVRQAIDEEVGALAGARVLPERRLVVAGVAEGDDPVWAHDEDWAALVDPAAESTYLHRGCLPVNDALGPDATAEDQEPVAPLVEGVEPLEAFSVSFAGDVMTARLGPARTDLHRRADLSAAWPDEVGFDDGFVGHQAADPTTGRIGLRVGDPQVAAGLTLTGALPFAVCDELEPLPEPTGL